MPHERGVHAIKSVGLLLAWLLFGGSRQVAGGGGLLAALCNARSPTIPPAPKRSSLAYMFSTHSNTTH